MMQTSATGPRSRPAPGFSLVELMVVLFMVGLLAGAVMLTSAAPEARLNAEADRLAQQLVRAREEAVMGNRAVALRIDPTGYSFSVERFGRWEPLAEPPFRTHPFEDEVRARLATADGVARFEFDATGITEGGTVDLVGPGGERRIAMDQEGRLDVQSPVR